MTIMKLSLQTITSTFLLAAVAAAAAAADTNNDDLRGKTALCLGCTRGIGEAAARQLASRGANVVVAGRSVDPGTKIANDIGGTFVRCDMAEQTDIEHVFEAAANKYGGIDAVFSNGGIEGEWDPLETISTQNVEKIGKINGMATLFVYDLAIKAFIKNGGGSLVFTSSIAAFVHEALSTHLPASGHVYYCGTKAIAPAMTRSSAMFPASHNIRINTITPAVYETEMVHDILKNSAFASTIGATTPSDWAAFNPLLPGCVGDASDAAAVAVEMLANTTAWPSSAVVVTDGPFSFESNVLSDKLGRMELWNVDASLLRDSKGMPVDVTADEIQNRIVSCAAASKTDETTAEL